MHSSLDHVLLKTIFFTYFSKFFFLPFVPVSPLSCDRMKMDAI